MLTDTHCHLFFDQLKDDLYGVLERANEQGVGRFICVGTSISCLLYTSPSPRDATLSRMPSSA